MKRKVYIMSIAAALMATTACEDLDQTPHTDMVSADVYTSEANYKAVLAKCYALFVTAGQEADGSADLSSNNGQGYIRNYFNLQESPTDEVFNTWVSGDKTRDITFMTWDASDPWVEDTYQRCYYTISVCNELLRHCSDGEISAFGADAEKIVAYRGEARFLRALCYSHVLDLFRKGPMVTEANNVGAYVPEVADAKELFAYIESELIACADEMLETVEYGRAPRAAAWALLAKLYLNAEVWSGENRYTDCVTYCKKIIDSKLYSLEPEYAKLFNASNHLRTNEIIFPFVVDAVNTMTWGATTYLVAGQICSSEKTDGYSATLWGVTDGAGWGMFRICGELFDKFGATIDDNETAGYYCPDSRAMFWCKGQDKTVDVNDPENQYKGYLVAKWSNLDDEGNPASDTKTLGCSIDYPMIRYAEVYLTLAEAVMRGGQGSSQTEALGYINELRQRAYGDASGDFGSLTLDNILDERARELYWECSRRTDLVRYNYLTTDAYLWDSKGGVAGGKAVDSKYNYYPIPANELTANPNLSNPEY